MAFSSSSFQFFSPPPPSQAMLRHLWFQVVPPDWVQGVGTEIAVPLELRDVAAPQFLRHDHIGCHLMVSIFYGHISERINSMTELLTKCAD